MPPSLLTAALLGSAAFSQNLVNPPVGFAFGDGAYLIETEAVRGDGVLLAGEAVSTNYLPARLYLENGAFAILGIGSHALVYKDRVRVRGVSFEMLGFGTPAVSLEVDGLLLVPASLDARVSVFTDHPGEVAVMVSAGDIEVRAAGGRVLRRLPAGSMATFTREQAEIRIDDDGAAPEIARICGKQLEMLAALEDYAPGVAPRRQAIAAMLSGPSESLVAIVREVHFRLNQEGLDEAGCGESECAAEDPPRWRNRFFGWAGGFALPGAGCALCEPENSGESEQP